MTIEDRAAFQVAWTHRETVAVQHKSAFEA